MKQQKRTVLIVDDDQNYLFLAQTMFESLGTRFKLQLLTSGDAAVAYLKGEGRFADRNEFEFPSYILTDLKMMPGDGFQLLEFIKSHPALSVVPVVMMSDSAQPRDVRQAYVLGASSYILKPSGLPALKALLRNIHDYWAQCEVPEVDAQGFAVPTDSMERLDARLKKVERPEGI